MDKSITPLNEEDKEAIKSFISTHLNSLSVDEVLNEVLDTLKKKVIGLFKWKGREIEMVVKYDNVRKVLTTIKLGPTLTVLTCTIPTSFGNLHLFEDGETLYDYNNKRKELGNIIDSLSKMNVSTYAIPGIKILP